MVKQHRNVMTFVDILAHLCILRRRAAGNRPLEIEGFVSARKRSLLTRIEAVMGKAIVLSDEAVPEDEADEDD
jgi:hypothetical protein